MKRLVKAPGAYCNVLILLLLALLVTCAPARAATYIVNKDTSSSDDDKILSVTVTSGDVHASLLNLVSDGVKSGDIVRIQPGTYTLPATLNLRSGVKLIGAGAENTILKGNNKFTIISCTTSSAIKENTLLSGFTVTAGMGNLVSVDSSSSSPSAPDESRGGGMYISDGASPEVTNCTFSGNTAGNSGGGMYITGTTSRTATPRVTNCTFVGCASPNGGGMYISKGSSPEVTNCTFAGNTANTNGGGGMHINGDGASPAVTNCTFAGNTANTNGGGMYIAGGATPTVANTILWGNTAGSGADIFQGGGTVTLKNCIISNDTTFGINPADKTDCLTGDPLLVSCDKDENTPATHADIRWYKLGTGSSAIGAGLAVGTNVTTLSGGVSVTVPATDRRGWLRPGADGKVDIGAWEHDGVLPASAPGPSPTPVDRSGATVTLTPTPGVELSGDQLLVDFSSVAPDAPGGSDAPDTSDGSITVTLRVTDWKDSRGNSVTPYEIRVFVGGVERREARMSAKAFAGGGVRGVTDTVTLTLTRADLDKLLEIKGHIAGDQWITQAFTVKQSGAVLPTPTPTPDPADPSDPTPTPTPDPTPADPTTPDSGGSSGGSGSGCQAMSFGLFGLAALALLKRK